MSFKDQYEIVHNDNTEEIGEDAQYTPNGGDSFELRGIFDNNFERIDTNSNTRISTNVCVFSCHLANFPSGVEPEKGDLIVIASQNYRVIDSQEDGQGGTKLILHRGQ